MTPIAVRIALRRSLRGVRHVRAVPLRRATGLVREVYVQTERDFGILAPPIGLHSPAPELLAASWIMLRESLVAAGSASRADKEVVAAAVSVGNSCPYCAEVHGMTLASLGRSADAGAIGGDRFDAIADPATRALAGWARGQSPVPPGISAVALPELVGTAVVFHYLNRMVNVFLESSPLPSAVPDSARGTVRSVLGRFLRPGEGPAPGTSLDLLPAATGVEPPDWSAGNEILASAFARVQSTMDAVAIPPRVREVVSEEVVSWDGTSPGLSRSWSDPALSALPQSERPLARLALITAKAAYQVDDELVADVRREGTDDRALVELVSWAGFLAAARLGALLPTASTTP